MTVIINKKEYEFDFIPHVLYIEYAANIKLFFEISEKINKDLAAKVSVKKVNKKYDAQAQKAQDETFRIFKVLFEINGYKYNKAFWEKEDTIKYKLDCVIQILNDVFEIKKKLITQLS